MKVILLAILHAVTLLGADPALKVGIAIFPPNVIEQRESEFSGFDIELWDAIGRTNNFEFTYKRMSFERLIEEVKNGEVDVGLAGITITREREQDMDFSHPYMQSGLRILTRTDESPGFVRLLRFLPESGILQPIGYLLAFLLICSHVLYLAEKGSTSISDNYIPGIFEASWCVLATITTVGYGDITPHRWLGRFVSFLVMVSGIALFGIIIAQLSAGLTLARLTAEIEGPDDLKGKTVATVAGSTSVEEAARYGARVREADVIDDAYEMLRQGEVDAVVFDAPPLMQFVKTSEEPFILTGPLLRSESYGIAFPEESALREPVNRALLQTREDGTYDRIYRKWFSDEQ